MDLRTFRRNGPGLAECESQAAWRRLWADRRGHWSRDTRGPVSNVAAFGHNLDTGGKPIERVARRARAPSAGKQQGRDHPRQVLGGHRPGAPGAEVFPNRGPPTPLGTGITQQNAQAIDSRSGYSYSMTCNAFVLGGGGVLGAAEVGMARALLETGIRPDLVCGTSIGAINGAAIAADPTPDGAKGLLAMWDALADDGALDGSLIRRVADVVRRPTSLHGSHALRRMLRDRLPVQTFEDLAVPFECVAASIERAREHWFSSGDLIEPILASCALPGVFPPVRIGDEHFFDGGLVNSIPLERAVARGADTVWVLHVGRLEEELAPPRFLWQVGFVAFEISRRHRFHSDLERVGSEVTVHVLPTGMPQRRAASWSNLRYRDTGRIARRAELAYDATHEYLEALP
jgi:NTE family protein